MSKFYKNMIISLFICIIIFSMTINTYAGQSVNYIDASSDAEHFSDIGKNDWFYSSVNYVIQNKLMNGTSNTTFSPHDYMTRGMFITVLWRLEGEPIINDDLLYDDVSEYEYFCMPITWATSNKIVNGYSKVSFGPNDCITREQLVTMLYRYSKYKGSNVHSDVSLKIFSDEKAVSEYACQPFQWAVGNNLVTGVTTDILAPERYAFRSECAAIINRFHEKLIMSEISYDIINENVFSDRNTGKNNTHKPSSDKNIEESTDKEKTDEEIINSETANDAISLTVGSTSVYPGDVFQIPVSISGNTGIIGMILTVTYDDNVLTLQSVSNGEAFDGILNMTASKELSSGARIIWDGINVDSDKIKDGNILYLNFVVTSEAASGNYPVRLSFEHNDIVDGNLNLLSLKIANGNVTVLKD